MGDYVGNLGKVSSSCSCTVQWPAVTAVTAVTAGSVIRTQDIAPSPPEPAEEHGSLIPASYKHCISLMIMCGVLLHQ